MQDDLTKVTGALMKGLMESSQDYRKKIEGAKTPFKKEYYKKKLKKNNIKLMNVLSTMERLGRVQDKIDQEDNNEDVQVPTQLSEDETESR